MWQRYWSGLVLVIAGLGVLGGVLWPTGRVHLRAEGDDGEQTVAPTPVPPGASGLLWELTERLLTQNYPVAGTNTGEAPKIQLLAGQLPPDLPLQIPVPAGARLVGSAVRTGGGSLYPTGDVSIVLDVPGSNAEIQRTYEQAFASQGWTVPASMLSGSQYGGFQATTSYATRTYCQGSAGSWLNLWLSPRQKGPNDLRITLQRAPVGASGGPSGSYGPCSAPTGLVMSPGPNLLPSLYLPDDVTVQINSSPIPAPAAPPGAAGPTFTEGVSTATAETPRSVAELESAIAKQLTAVGWQRQRGQVDGPLAWSLWTLPGGGQSQGFLTVLEAPGTNRRYLSLRAEAPAGSTTPPSAGGTQPNIIPVPPLPVAPSPPPAGR